MVAKEGSGGPGTGPGSGGGDVFFTVKSDEGVVGQAMRRKRAGSPLKERTVEACGRCLKSRPAQIWK